MIDIVIATLCFALLMASAVAAGAYVLLTQSHLPM